MQTVVAGRKVEPVKGVLIPGRSFELAPQRQEDDALSVVWEEEMARAEAPKQRRAGCQGGTARRIVCLDSQAEELDKRSDHIGRLNVLGDGVPSKPHSPEL
jgi:hypothetical protein